MHDPRAEYLRTLHQTLLQETEPAVARAVHHEIEAHLDAAIQARMELGDPYSEAVQRAVDALGAPKTFVPVVGAVHDPNAMSNDQRMRNAGLAFAGLLSSFLFVSPFFLNAGNNTAFLQLYLSFGLCFLTLVGVFSFLTRKVAVLRMAKVAALAGFGIWIGLSTLWFDLHAEGGAGVLPRWEADSTVQLQAEMIAKNVHEQAVIKSIIDARGAKGDDVGHLRSHLAELQRQGVEWSRHRGALFAGITRTVPERMVASVGDALRVGATSFVGLMIFNLAGAHLGRRWRRRRTRESVHA